ncbi:MAG: tRNA preQ1(34) S-adenosylmethionine ribosyltransferase-isomerase QueA [Firmicutes bacterium]|nr:tRNA preQ1(34) S-adenosylmethionine ribosyltransferase-isomerase QueA [Bacillota bacterium]
MKLSDFDYYLPEELIAQEPPAERTGSRLMIVSRPDSAIYHGKFPDITGYLKEGDLLVLNDTKVIPARLWGEKENSGGKVELLLLNMAGENTWETLAKPGRRVQPGHILTFGGGVLKGEVVGRTDQGTRLVRFNSDHFMEDLLKLGEVPLPHYIKKPLEDKDRYQTIYAKYDGSSAAPTAGLHFTDEIFDILKNKGVETEYLTLHIGPGTFRPVKTENIEDHDMHSEYYKIKRETLERILKAKKEGRRIIPVGTTATRTLETAAGKLEALNGSGGLDFPDEILEGWTNIFIYPGYRFKLTDALITNFHLPKSTLLMLVSALAGREFMLKAYNEAVAEKYRFFSFGDCMFIQ